MLQSQNNQETERVIKYFLAQALGSAIILYSRIILYYVRNQTLIQFMLMMRLLLKLGAAPCHYWFPSTMSSIRWLNCLILCTWQKLGPLALLIFPFISSSNHLKPLLILVASINAVMGGLLGINQSHIRTILAYSSITHIGWIIGSLLTGFAIIPIIYFIIYSFIVTPIFIMLNSWKSVSFLQIPQMLISSLHISIIFSLTLLSLGGLPPLTGFIPKWITIIILSGTNWVLIIFLLLGRLINLYFYLNLTFNILLSSFILNTSNKPFNPTTLRLLSVGALNILGVFPIIIYAMTLLYKSQRHWHPIYNLWPMSRNGRHRNKTLNSIWISSTWLIPWQRSII